MKYLMSILFVLTVYSCQNPKPVLSFQFDKDKDMPHVKTLLDLPEVSLAEGNGIDGSNAIKVAYIGYERGSKRVVNEFKLPHCMSEATLRYAVKFKKSFQFVKGGKLHGFGPYNKITGGNHIHPEGWSARVVFKDSGRVRSYIYHQNLKGVYGEGPTSKEQIFIPGKFQQVALYVKLNEPASEKNGIYELWVDGNQIFLQDNIQYRGEHGEKTNICKFLFSTFHGGHLPSYAPVDSSGSYTTEIAWFDNFEIYKGKYIER